MAHKQIHSHRSIKPSNPLAMELLRSSSLVVASHSALTYLSLMDLTTLSGKKHAHYRSVTNHRSDPDAYPEGTFLPVYMRSNPCITVNSGNLTVEGIQLVEKNQARDVMSSVFMLKDGNLELNVLNNLLLTI